MTELTTIDPNNYGAMAKAMGIANEAPAKAKSSSLARLRINHSPIMGTAEVKGKSVNVETVSGGTYKLEIPDGDTYYFNGCDIGIFGDGQSVWEALVSSDFNNFPFPSPCKHSCGCDPTRSYYFENDPEAFAEQCLDRNGSPNGECVGEIVTSVEATPLQIFEGTPTIYSQFGTPVGSAPVYGYIFIDASLCGIPVAKYNTADVKAVESLNIFRDEPFPKNITAAPICSQE